MENSTFDIRNNTKGELPSLPFAEIKNDVLGKKYELSLVFCGSTLSRRLNRERRGKDKPANVLSFPLTEKSGEIFIDVGHAKKQAPQFEVSHEDFLAILFIHGLYHLKGMDHGSKMERGEEATKKKWKI